VIIPARNAADHLPAQLKALAQQQTDVPWELILVDNGSTDETVAVARSTAAGSPVPTRVLDASDRNGAIGARNAGAAAAQGQYLLFTDADDVVDEHWVQEMVHALRERELVGGRLEVVKLNGEEVASWRMNLFDQDLPTVAGRPWVPGNNFGCTAAAYQRVGGFDESLVVGEDLDLSLRMHAHGVRAGFAERAIVHYRYRREPWPAVRQMWAYGRCRKTLYVRYGLELPTWLDTLIRAYRDVRAALGDALRGVRPMGAALDLAFVMGEASVIWTLPGFWRPSTRIVRVENPLRAQRRRIRRLRRWLGR
jgi:glycosyltransferase involved in cell wall biosynthesis